LENNKIRDELMNYLKEKGIATKIYFEPCHKYSIFKKLGYDVKLPITEDISSRILTLPMYPHMSESELICIINTIKEFFVGGKNE
jgi:perosamine synthetase